MTGEQWASVLVAFAGGGTIIGVAWAVAWAMVQDGRQSVERTRVILNSPTAPEESPARCRSDREE